MIDADRLDELSTWLPESDTPDDAKIRIPAGDLRDLVGLIPVVRAAYGLEHGKHPECAVALFKAICVAQGRL